MTIDKLIKELKYLKITIANLKDIAFLSGWQYLSPSLWRNGKIPIVTNCDEIYGYTNKANRNVPCISISSRWYAGKTIQYWKIPIWASKCITITQKDSKFITLKYLLLLFTSNKLTSFSTNWEVKTKTQEDVESQFNQFLNYDGNESSNVGEITLLVTNENSIKNKQLTTTPFVSEFADIVFLLMGVSIVADSFEWVVPTIFGLVSLSSWIISSLMMFTNN